MAKFYVLRLKDGKVLAFDNSKFHVEETGYPMPTCCLPVGDAMYLKQDDIVQALLGYHPKRLYEVIDFALGADGMSFNEFKYRVLADNIGDGCPERLQKLGKYIVGDGLSEEQGYFACNCPSFSGIAGWGYVSRYGSIALMLLKYRLNMPNNIFKNHFLAYTGLKGYLEKYLGYLMEVLDACTLRDSFKYYTVIRNAEGVGSVVFSDSEDVSEDLIYFYTLITGADLREVCVTVEGNLEISCEDSEIMKFYGSYERGVLSEYSE